MSRGSRRKRVPAPVPGSESTVLSSAPADATRPETSPDGAPERRFSAPRSSTLVLALLFAAIFALWVVLPNVPDPAAAQTGYNPNSGGVMPTSSPTARPSPSYTPTPTYSPTPTRTPTETPRPTSSPDQAPTQSPTTGASPTATSGTGVPGTQSPAPQSTAPATGTGNSGGAAAGASSPAAGTSQAPAGIPTP